MKRSCELCKRPARLLCESDQASLCWNCDAKVHSANFLVARHSRRLLCRVCQSPTSWSAAGSKLEPTFSDCRSCVKNKTDRGERYEEDEQEVLEEKQEVVENQVAPWSPQPPASESSLSGGEAVATRKRGRLVNDHHPTHDDGFNSPSCTAAEVGRADAREVRISKSPADEAVRRSLGEEMECLSDGSAVDLDLSLRLFSR